MFLRKLGERRRDLLVCEVSRRDEAHERIRVQRGVFASEPHVRLVMQDAELLQAGGPHDAGPRGARGAVRGMRFRRSSAAVAPVTGGSSSVTVTAANVHDKWMVAQTLDAVVVSAPRGPHRPKTLCLDKGYDYDDAEAAVRVRGIKPHLRRRGEWLRTCSAGDRVAGWSSARTAGTTTSARCASVGRPRRRS